MNKRIEELDILKGMAMLLVIVGHYFHPHMLAYTIWSFHMPLFVIISGYFIKKDSWSEMGCRTRRITNKYLKVYLLTWLVIVLYKVTIWSLKHFIFHSKLEIGLFDLIKTWVISLLYAQGNEIIIDGTTIPAIGAIWFLMALVIGQVLIWIAFKVNNIIIRCFILIFISVILTILNLYIRLPLQIYAGSLFACWLMVGYLIKSYKSNYWLNRILKPNFVVLIIVLVIWIFSIRWELYINEPFDVSVFKYKLNIIGYLGACSGSLCFYYLARFVTLHSRRKVKNVLTAVGKNTLLVLAVHSVDMVCLTPLWEKINLHSLVIMAIRLGFDIEVAFLVDLFIKKTKQNFPPK